MNEAGQEWFAPCLLLKKNTVSNIHAKKQFIMQLLLDTLGFFGVGDGWSTGEQGSPTEYNDVVLLFANMALF